MELRERLESHPVTNLRKEISKKAKEINLRGYSKMKKAELINFMLDHKDKFNYIQVHTKGTKGEKKTITVKKEKEPKKKKIKFKLTGRSGKEVMQEKKEKEKPKKKIMVKRRVKGKKVVGGSVDGKEI